MLITSSGLDKIKADLSDLNETKRPALVTRLSIARSMGDLSENSDYISAKEELAFMDGQIAELEDLIKNAKVVSPSTNEKVDFGHKVTVKLAAKEIVYHLVGEWEANPMEKKISVSSPLGQALMGKKVGDKISVPAPAGEVVYTVLSIA